MEKAVLSSWHVLPGALGFSESTTVFHFAASIIQNSGNGLPQAELSPRSRRHGATLPAVLGFFESTTVVLYLGSVTRKPGKQAR
jgi:hypothetical protein